VPPIQLSFLRYNQAKDRIDVLQGRFLPGGTYTGGKPEERRRKRGEKKNAF
jgi:hypothetical protein